MAVRRIGIERDVGQHADLRRRVLGRLDRAADEIVGVERLARVVAAQSRRACWERGRCTGMPRSRASPRLRADPVDRPARHAGQGRDRLLGPLPFGDEQGPDQVGRASAWSRRPAPGSRRRSGCGAGEGRERRRTASRQGLARPIRACKAAKDERLSRGRASCRASLKAGSDRWHYAGAETIAARGANKALSFNAE